MFHIFTKKREKNEQISPVKFTSEEREHIRQQNRELSRMRWEMHRAQDEGKYFFMDLDIDSLPYEDLKKEYDTMLACLSCGEKK